MSVKSKLKNFTVQLKLVVVVDAEVKAQNMVQAMEQATFLKDVDVVTYKAPVNESRVSVLGIFGGEEWDT
jgi:hypothetical protein